MLGFLMPFTGTADRKFDDPGAGITGFVLPAGATPETRKLYAKKLVTIAWTFLFPSIRRARTFDPPATLGSRTLASPLHHPSSPWGPLP